MSKIEQEMDNYITWLLNWKPTPRPRIPKITIENVDKPVPRPRIPKITIENVDKPQLIITASPIHSSKIPHQLRNIEDKWYVRGLPNTFDIKSPIIKSTIENVFSATIKKRKF